MAWLTDIMWQGLEFFFRLTGSYGLAIIFLTLVVRVVLLPFTFSQMRSIRRMQELQPEIKKIQEKYKKDPQRLNQETMALWRKNKVNPLSGCLPLLLQFPFLIALFRVLQFYDYAAAAQFLWIQNLGAPDSTYILPILAAVTTFWQSRISTMPTGSGDSSQRTMLYIMPLFIAWISTRYAAGLSVYWVMSNVFAIVQQYLTPSLKASPAGSEAK